MFGVVFSTLPFLLNGLLLFSRGVNGPIYFYYLWPRGELLLVAAAIAAEGVSELIGGRTQSLKIIAAGACVALLFLEGAWFAVIQIPGQFFRPEAVSRGSLGYLC